MKHTRDTTGYDPGGPADGPDPIVRYELVRHEAGRVYRGILARVETSDGRRLGFIECNTEEEFKWLKDLLSQTERTRSDEELNRLSERK